MKTAALLLIVLSLLASAPNAWAQPQTGNLYGVIVDEQGSPLPGVTVTLTGPGAPQVHVTNAQGQFRFLGLGPGGYQAKAELEGFSTIEYPNLHVNAGRNTSIEVTLASAVEEVITVTADSPLLDEQRISTGAAVSETGIERIPTARDPWVVLQQTPGVLMDRINVAGSESGQQSQFVGRRAPVTRELTLEDFGNMLAGNDLVIPPDIGPAVSARLPTYSFDPSRARELLEGAGWTVGADGVRAPTPKINLTFGSTVGGAPATAPPAIRDGGIWLLTPQIGGYGGNQPTWSVDGVVITDMGALGSSPSYYDFDSFEETQVTTPGVVLNMVTKRGTNEWRGSGRYFISGGDWQGAQQQQGTPTATVEDYGAELGGPIIKDRLWVWGSYGSQQETFVDPSGAEREWDWDAVQNIANTLTVDENGNDANSPDFDPTKVVQFGYGLDCGIPGYSAFSLTPLQGQDPCPTIRTSVQNLFGTGAFQGYLQDPFQLGLPYSALHVPAQGGPLYVVDGTPVTDAAQIEPGSIQDIEVLGGAAATALYGSPGANGVVLIVTKSAITGAAGTPHGVAGIAVDPSDPSGNTVYATGLDGGAWRTTNFLTRDPTGPTWTLAPQGDPAHTSSYLTGLYSNTSGGFQLVPQSTGGAVEMPVELAEGGDLVIGWKPLLREGMTWSDGQPITAADLQFAEEMAQAMILDRTDFTRCPDGSWLGMFRFGNSMDIGNGSSFQPFTPVPDPCPKVDWRMLGNVGSRLNLSSNWFVAGTGLREEEREEQPVAEAPVTDELILGVEHALLPEFVVGVNLTYRKLNEILDGNPFESLNFNGLNGFPILLDDQNFGARFRLRLASRAPSPEPQGPGGSQEAGAPENDGEPTVLLVSTGRSTGEAFTAYVLGDGPVSLDGIAAVEPVAAPLEEVARFEQAMKDAGAAVAAVEGYCFEFDGLVPAAGTAYRFAPREVQQALAPLARVLEAGQRVKDAGGLVPDTEIGSYFPAISQWAVWAREKGFDVDSYGEAWLGLVKKNVEQAGERWTAQLEQAVRERVPGRWRDIQKILGETDGGGS